MDEEKPIRVKPMISLWEERIEYEAEVAAQAKARILPKAKSVAPSKVEDRRDRSRSVSTLTAAPMSPTLPQPAPPKPTVQAETTKVAGVVAQPKQRKEKKPKKFEKPPVLLNNWLEGSKHLRADSPSLYIEHIRATRRQQRST